MKNNSAHTILTFLAVFDHPGLRDCVQGIAGELKPNQGFAVEEQDERCVKEKGIPIILSV